MGQICIGFDGANGAGLCRTTGGCTLVPQDGCDSGQGCYIVGSSADGTVGCFGAGTTAVGETCEPLINACVPGAICLMETCREFCDRTAAEDPCPAGFMCGGLTGFEDEGVCVPET